LAGYGGVGAGGAKSAKNIRRKVFRGSLGDDDPRKIPFGLSRRLKEGSVRGDSDGGVSIVVKVMIMAKSSRYRAFCGE